MKTKRDVARNWGWTRKSVVVPKGTPVTPADSLPQGGYWVQPWPGISRELASWVETYGFLVDKEDVE